MLEVCMEQQETGSEQCNSRQQQTSAGLRIFTFGRFSLTWIDQEDGHLLPVPPERLQTGGAAPPLALLKALLGSPDRFATRSWLLEQFWPTSKQSRANARLNDVVSALRGLLRPPGSEEKIVHFVYGAGGQGAGYRLDGYPQMWCDADAFSGMWSMA